MSEPPLFPVGECDQLSDYDTATRMAYIDTLAAAPAALAAAVNGLNDAQLDAPYRNWTIRQIVHHLADSHMHSYIRTKWTLTEDQPLIKAYDESEWSRQPDALAADVGPSLMLIDGLHQRWVDVWRRMSDGDFRRAFEHPETDEIVPLSLALNYYAWHSRHHTAQINWVRTHRL